MGIVGGTLLVLLTWIILGFLLVVVGFGFSLLTAKPETPILDVIRRAAWWGLAIFTALVLLASVYLPLRSAGAFGVVAGGSLVFVVMSVFVGLRKQQWSRMRSSLFLWRWRSSPVSFALIGVVALVAVRALGPANNYDTGLYHLGSVGYAGEFSTIPGLANVFNAFGYSNSIFPLAAFLGNGPWDGNGYRLINGFIVSLVVFDLLCRLRFRLRSPGTYLMIIGVTGMFLPLVAVTDFWVTSPTSDSAVMLLTLVATVYLVDALTTERNFAADSAIVVLALILMVSMRPTMLFFAAAASLVLFIILIRRRRSLNGIEAAWSFGSVGALALFMGTVQVARDYLLSGWLLYPLSLLPFDVDWRAVDPVNLREATLAAARDPSAPEYWPVAHSWNWIDEWFIARLSMWETYFVLLGFLGLALVALIAFRADARVQYRPMLLAVFPSVIAVVTWFTVSPPSYRFIWGPLFLVFMVPLAFVVHSITDRWVWPLMTSAMAVTLGAVAVFTALVRVDYQGISELATWTLGPISIEYTYSPPPIPETTSATTEWGLHFVSPVNGEQCWAVFPLCSPNVGQTVSGRGNLIQDGFRQ